MNMIKAWVFRKAMHWYVNEQLDQWARFIVHSRHGPVYVQVDLQKPDDYNWDELRQ